MCVLPSNARPAPERKFRKNETPIGEDVLQKDFWDAEATKPLWGASRNKQSGSWDPNEMNWTNPVTTDGMNQRICERMNQPIDEGT